MTQARVECSRPSFRTAMATRTDSKTGLTQPAWVRAMVFISNKIPTIRRMAIRKDFTIATKVRKLLPGLIQSIMPRERGVTERTVGIYGRLFTRNFTVTTQRTQPGRPSSRHPNGEAALVCSSGIHIPEQAHFNQMFWPITPFKIFPMSDNGVLLLRESIGFLFPFPRQIPIPQFIH